MAAKVALFTLLAGNERADKTNQNTIFTIFFRLSHLFFFLPSILCLLSQTSFSIILMCH